MRRTVLAYFFAAGTAILPIPVLGQSHDMAAPATPDTLAGWAKGAQLFDGLGTFHRKITTRSPLAQKYFDQGMRFIWAFNHDEATRSFAKAAQIDPRCASCYWGVALTLGPNYNMPMMSSPRARVGWEAVRKAEANARRATPVERALIAAVAKRYSGDWAKSILRTASRCSLPMSTRCGGSPRAIRTISTSRRCTPKALMNTNPWKLWKADGTPNPGTEQIVERFNARARQGPEASRRQSLLHPCRRSVAASGASALSSAEALEGMMPAAGHLEHMPAHIMQRVGTVRRSRGSQPQGRGCGPRLSQGDRGARLLSDVPHSQLPVPRERGRDGGAPGRNDHSA